MKSLVLSLACALSLVGFAAQAQEHEEVGHDEENRAAVEEHLQPAHEEHAAPADAHQAAEHLAPTRMGPDGKPCPVPRHEAVHHDAPNYILHHVQDDQNYVFEIPWTGFESKPTLRLGEIFAGLQFERTPCACSMEVPKSMSAFPSIGKWSNGCYDLRPTKAVFMMWIAAALLIIFALISVNRDKNKLVPTGVASNVIEVLTIFVRNELAVPSIGKKHADKYVPFLATCFFFILFMNWLGLVPNMATATGNIGVTLALAVFTFLLSQAAGIRSAGLGGYLKHLTGGVPAALWPIMIPVEVLGLFTKPFALTVRLFANMLAGHIVLFFMLGLIFMLHPALATVSVPVAVALYFLEIFVGLLQAYIFTMLSALFIGMGVEMGHHAHAEHGDHEHGHGSTEHAH